MILKYEIVLKSQLGPRLGALRIRVSEERLLGVLELLDHKSLLVGNTADNGNSSELHGRMWTPLGKAECLICMTRKDDSIRGMLTINHQGYEISGTKQV